MLQCLGCFNCDALYCDAAAGMVTCIGQTEDDYWVYVPLLSKLHPFTRAHLVDMDNAAVTRLLLTLSMLTNVCQMTFRELPKELLFWDGAQLLLLPLVFLDLSPGTLMTAAEDLQYMGLGEAAGE
jgi:hypothetical protein